MNRAERLSAVLDLLAESGQVEVDQIVDRLDVSPATARRDLDALAEHPAAVDSRTYVAAGRAAVRAEAARLLALFASTAKEPG